jgi:hypothetical protein
MIKSFVVLALVLVACTSIHEIPMNHRVRSPTEAKMFIDYMNRGPLVQGTLNIIQNLFPMTSKPNIYSYPEVKIYNYLDAQYYG